MKILYFSVLKDSDSNPDSVLEAQGHIDYTGADPALNDVESSMKDSNPEPVTQTGPKKKAQGENLFLDRQNSSVVFIFIHSSC